MLEKQAYYKSWLFSEFANRKEKNIQYSLRAFARDLNVSKTALSDVLAGKRNFSKKAALKIADRLCFTPKQKQILFNEIFTGGFAGACTAGMRAGGVSDNARCTGDKLGRKFDIIPNTQKQDSVDHAEFLQLQEDQFQVMSNWYYIGILALPQLSSHKADLKWIAKRLGISEIEAKNALLTLNRLGLIEVKDGKLIRLTPPISTTNHIPSPAIRTYHKQNLKLAGESLEKNSIDQRIFSAITIPLDLSKDLSKIKIAGKLIDEFKLKLSKALDSSAPTELYTLSIQLFPITKKGETP